MRSDMAKDNLLDSSVQRDTQWHSIDATAALELLQTSESGLNAGEAAKRSETFGANALPAKEPPTIWAILLHQIMNPLIFILIAAAAVSLLIGEATDAIFILAVIVLNSALGAYQEYSAEKSAASLQNLLKIKARVRRDGKTIELPSEELVPGDIVLLESGLKAPADLRLLEARNLAADESFLTGESIASDKNTKPLSEEAVVSERSNMCFAGSGITSGRGLGVVVATGMQTEVGAIAENVSQSESAKPPLVLRMEKFTKQLSILVVLIGVVLAIILRMKGMEIADIFFFVVALAVSAIPEGLPVALTVALSIATSRMSKRNVIVRKLTAVESLGSCTVIASDKTGTLTVNQQTAREVRLADGARFTFTGEGYRGNGVCHRADGADPDESELKRLRALAVASVMANEAELELEGEKWTHQGDAMDVAMLAMAWKLGVRLDEVRAAHTVLDDIPYESERKFSAAFYDVEGRTHAAMKGAVETVLQHCGSMQSGSDVLPIATDPILEQAEAMAANGLRVLAVAAGEHVSFSKRENYGDEDLPDLTFLGLVGFIDPLRSEAIDAVNTCKDAGIKVLMITGDHPLTAGAIARDLGIAEEGEAVVTGAELAKAGPYEGPEFEKIVESANVFARVSPAQKLEIVDVFIRKGEFLAVTGDGVNDAPAMRRANIGVAMGSGTDVAKEISSMIVTDDNFSSIVAGVEEGRFAYDNVRKVTYLLISTGAAEVLLFLIAVLFGMPLPLLAVQMLWLNLVTNGIQDVALAFEGGEPGAMKRKPRRTTEGIFNPLMISQTVVSGLFIGLVAFGFWYYMIEIEGMNEFAARNILLLLIVFMQNVHVFNCRSEYVSAFKIPISRNYILIGGVILAQGIHLLSMHLPFMQTILRVETISTVEWAQVLVLALPLLLVMELFKIVWKKLYGTDGVERGKQSA
jgi:magnesium-transporting ATPase (P-type)